MRESDSYSGVNKLAGIIQEMLSLRGEQIVTPAVIEEVYDQVLKMVPGHSSVDREAVTAELIRRFSIWNEEDRELTDGSDHEPWLKIAVPDHWRYWPRYRQKMTRELSSTVVQSIDDSTHRILAQLENPEREGVWDRRGMVVGLVQSGKTSNYTGLITKAADAGYKIIIVLSGLHNNLRAQTQIRIDSDFIGFETSLQAQNKLKPTGVGLIDRDPSARPHYLTDRSSSGDFSQKSMSVGTTPETKPLILVVKKQKTVLERLHLWIKAHLADPVGDDSREPKVSKFPLLMIDDEADQASVDTVDNNVDFRGNVDLDHDPSTINRLIRRILHTFDRKAYVGYTATPFANIFIHEKAETSEEGPDLFPAAFIYSLGAPSNYVGPQKMFGFPTTEGREGALPLIESIDDAFLDERQGWMPPRHKSDHVPYLDTEHAIPESLVTAILFFVLSCAIRAARGDGGEHSSMLVHVTRFVKVQNRVARDVENFVLGLKGSLRYSINSDGIIRRIKHLYYDEYAPKRTLLSEFGYDIDLLGEEVSWDAVEGLLPRAVEEIQVRAINGSVRDCLDYKDTVGGLKVIAIGGDKLSRGLTLEGLTCSYFLRASKMYDTLMQMGRWFGYRDKYLDVCRLFTTSELRKWMEHIADASSELQEAFEEMVNSGGTPREFGLRVRSHSSLLVTSSVKMRHAQKVSVTFSGDVCESVAFKLQKEAVTRNLQALSALVDSAGPNLKLVGSKGGNKYLARQVSHEVVTMFLDSYVSHPDSFKANSTLIAKFVREMVKVDELTEWSILLKSGEGALFDISESVKLHVATRKPESVTKEKMSISRLLSPNDESEDLLPDYYKEALRITINQYEEKRAKDPNSVGNRPPSYPSGPVVRALKGKGNNGLGPLKNHGLLIIYLIDNNADIDYETRGIPLVGFGVSFPSSGSAVRTEYRVNNVYWEQELGG